MTAPASCQNGHTWTFVRKYNGTEIYDVKWFIDLETGDQVDPASVGPDDPRDFDVACRDERRSDSYDGVIEEYLECRDCTAVITPERVGAMDTVF